MDTVRPHHATDEMGDAGYLLEMISRPVPWADDAACREHPEVSWFPARGEDVRIPKRICAGCLARTDCLAWALDQGPDLDGIWGGMSKQDRRAIRLGRAA